MLKWRPTVNLFRYCKGPVKKGPNLDLNPPKQSPSYGPGEYYTFFPRESQKLCRYDMHMAWKNIYRYRVIK